MSVFVDKLFQIAREENEHVNDQLEVRAASSVRVCQGVSTLVFLVFIAYEIVFAVIDGEFDIRPVYLLPVVAVICAGPISTLVLKHGYYECLGKYLLIIMHVLMILLAFWLDCFTELSLCVVYVPLFIAVGPVMLLRSIRTELFINTAALLGYFVAAWFDITPIEPSHAVMTGIVAYLFSLFSLITVSFMRYTIASTSQELARKETAARVEREQRFTLQEALNAAQRANIAKTTFLNSVSHDIRTPINAIVGYSSHAASNVNNPETVNDSLKHINSATQQLLGYVGSLLDVTDQSSNRVGYITTRFSLSELMGEVAAKFSEQARVNGVELVVDTSRIVDDEVRADRARLSRVMYVLLENSVAYTSKGGSIKFSACQTDRLSHERVRYVFRVKDTGMGIPPARLETIFDPFAHEYDPAKEATTNFGLGLPLVKTMVEASGGSVHIKSEEGVGTEVIILLPLGVTEDDGAEPKYVAIDGSGTEDDILENQYKGAHILVVDDNALNREIACDLLTDIGFVCETAENGSEAVAMYKDSMPGYYLALLMDILMPGMDGMQAASAIRKLNRTDAKTVSIIALSANMETVDAERAMASGMNAFLNKPFQVEEFLRVLKHN